MRDGSPAAEASRTAGWLAALALSMTALGACASDSATGDEGAVMTSEGELSTRWTLPKAVADAGARVRIAYEGAPAWEGTGSCGGKLTAGARKVGEHLRDRFDAVSSVGGYSCRPNTANTSRMSVHGTGRALDVFIPKKDGAADAAAGDPVANWLVVNASRIGVQLVIWNRTIWRSNGTNDGPYGGPNPHIDHLHVELTSAAGREQTPWFADPTDTREPGGSPDDPFVEGPEPDVADPEPGELDSLDTPFGVRRPLMAGPGCAASADGAAASPVRWSALALALGAVTLGRRARRRTRGA